MYAKGRIARLCHVLSLPETFMWTCLASNGIVLGFDLLIWKLVAHRPCGDEKLSGVRLPPL
jgi:hypothetical protein